MKIFFTPYVVPVVIVALLAFWVVLRDERFRLAFLLALSVAILGLLHPAFAAIALALIFGAHQLVQMWTDKRISGGRAVLFVVAVGVVAIAVGKYGQQALMVVWESDDVIVRYFIMPLGLSYFVFRVLQYVFDCLRGVIQEHSLLRLLTFVMFIPTFPAGPLETYQGFYSKRSLTFDRELFYVGLRRIVLGYFKKVFVVDFVIAIYCGQIMTAIGKPAFDWTDVNPLWPLAYCIIVFVRAYFDLSAYTDLAIGFSALFGFRIMENFHYPFWQQNLGDFWRSWHISLSSWCRNNVYFPVFGRTRRVWVGLYASMLTMGLWHYVSLNWTVWGLYHGTGLVVVARYERWSKARRKARKKAGLPHEVWFERYWRWLGYPATFLYVALGYAFVTTHSLRHALTIIYAAFRLPAEWLVQHFS